MNNFLRSVLIRRSIYKFDRRQIRDEELREILEEGKTLSHVESNQAWHFTVVQNRELLQQLNEANHLFLQRKHSEVLGDNFSYEQSRLVIDVPSVLIISGRRELKCASEAANTVFGSMMLAAEKYGIGSCWLSKIAEMLLAQEGHELLAQLAIPEGYLPLCAGGFGYREPLEVAEFGTIDDSFVNVIR